MVPDLPGDSDGVFAPIYRPRQAWEWMHQTLQVPAPGDWVRGEVATSWQRCLEDYPLSFRLSDRMAALRRLMFQAPDDGGSRLSGLAALIEQVSSDLPAVSGLTLCLVDARCRLLSSWGEALRHCPLERHLSAPNADWSEAGIGNNGLGSAAVTGAPIAFCGEEHYLPLLHPYATAGYPLFDPSGQLAAVVGLLSDREISPALLKSLMCMVGSRIEENLLKREFPRGLPVRLRSGSALGSGRAARLDGLILVDAERRILAATRDAGTLLGMSPEALAGRNLGSVLDLRGHDASCGSQLAVPDGQMAQDQERLAPIPARPAFAEAMLERAVRYQQRRIPILVVGESGAGKEYLVRRAYEAGPRRSGPFIALNCASLPRELIESELFGYAGGSFTGANREGKAGKFLLADKGVLFLDEIGDMSLDLQAVLLRVLENSEFFPIGATRPVKVDVQIFAATNVPIQEAVREGRFRRDLYYRLNGAQLTLPPLREREDKAAIIDGILRREAAAAGLQPGIRLAGDVLDLFLRHPWPGNIRQLSNVIRSSLPLTDAGLIRIEDLPQDFFEELEREPAPIVPGLPTPDYRRPIPETLRSLAEWESEVIEATLAACNGNITRAARILGITRSTLYKKIAQYGIGNKLAETVSTH